MEELRKGIQRLEEERRVKEQADEQISADAEATRSKSSLFANTLATLGRLSSSYRRDVIGRAERKQFSLYSTTT